MVNDARNKSQNLSIKSFFFHDYGSKKAKEVFLEVILGVISDLESHLLFFRKAFREGTYTPLWGVRA